jgi:hypothetical protein
MNLLNSSKEDNKRVHKSSISFPTTAIAALLTYLKRKITMVMKSKDYQSRSASPLTHNKNSHDSDQIFLSLLDRL